MLALAGAFGMAQCHQDADRGVHAGRQVGDRHSDFQRRAVRLAGHAHQPAHPLGKEIIAAAPGIGAILPEPGDRAVDDCRVERGDAGVIEPVLRQAPDLEILHQHVRLCGKAADQSRAFGVGQVDRGGALVAVGAQVIGAFQRIVAAIGQLEERRTPGAGIVAPPGLLHLEHVGAEIGEDLGRPRPGEDPRKVQHPDPVERARALAHHAAMPGRSREV